MDKTPTKLHFHTRIAVVWLARAVHDPRVFWPGNGKELNLLSSKWRAAMLVVLGSLGVSAFTASGAQAGSQVFISAQYVGDSGVFGYVDPLYRVNALGAGYNACVNALTYPNGPWAGTTYCGTSPDHPYNSSNRWGWSGAAPGTVEDIYATEYW